MLGSYAVIGFLPYGQSARFEGRGGLTVLAYPRLFLMLAMLAVSVRCLWSRGEPAVTAQVGLRRARPDDAA